MRKRLFIGELGRLAPSGLVRQSWLRRQDGHPGKFGRSAIQANFCRSGIQANFAGQQTRQLLHDVLGLQPRTARSALCSPQSGRWMVLGSASGSHMQMAYWGSTETRSPQREVGLVHQVEVQGRFSLRCELRGVLGAHSVRRCGRIQQLGLFPGAPVLPGTARAFQVPATGRRGAPWAPRKPVARGS